MKIAITYFVILAFAVFIPITKAESFDSEAISQLSKGIADWKTMNDDKRETQAEPLVYVSSSLSGVVEKNGGEGIGVIKGLASFGDDNYFKSEIRNWELNIGAEASNRCISRLPTNPLPNRIYDMSRRTFTYSVGQYVATEYGYIGSQIFNSVTTVGIPIIQAAGTFLNTVDYMGKAAQIISPPIYLHEKTSYGWRGEGSYSIPGDRVYYQETLKTAGSGPITRTHTDWVSTNTKTYIRNVEIQTLPQSSFERFMLYHYPLGDYYDPNKTTITTITKIQQNYRIETIDGMSKVAPLPSSRIGTWTYGGVGGNWSTLPPTLNATWKTVKMGSTVIKYPSIDWTSIPKTNWTIQSAIPTYTPSIQRITTYTSPTYKIPSYSTYSTSKMPSYTPTMPSSSGGRKY